MTQPPIDATTLSFLFLSDPDVMVVKIGIILGLLGIVDAGISVQWSEINGLRTVVMPLRTATLIVSAVGLVTFGLTLK